MSVLMPVEYGGVRIVIRWRTGRSLLAKDFGSIQELNDWRTMARFRLASIHYWCVDNSGTPGTSVRPGLLSCDDGTRVCMIIEGNGDLVKMLNAAVQERCDHLVRRRQQPSNSVVQLRKQKPLPIRPGQRRTRRAARRRRAKV